MSPVLLTSVIGHLGEVKKNGSKMVKILAATCILMQNRIIYYL